MFGVRKMNSVSESSTELLCFQQTNVCDIELSRNHEAAELVKNDKHRSLRPNASMPNLEIGERQSTNSTSKSRVRFLTNLIAAVIGMNVSRERRVPRLNARDTNAPREMIEQLLVTLPCLTTFNKFLSRRCPS